MPRLPAEDDDIYGQDPEDDDDGFSFPDPRDIISPGRDSDDDNGRRGPGTPVPM